MFWSILFSSDTFSTRFNSESVIDTRYLALLTFPYKSILELISTCPQYRFRTLRNHLDTRRTIAMAPPTHTYPDTDRVPGGGLYHLCRSEVLWCVSSLFVSHCHPSIFNDRG
jgi:hypothetical protein